MDKISEPGVYDIPMEFYHSDCCIGPSISSSGLRTIELECEAEYWAFSYLNPDRFEKPSTDAFNMGRAAHCLLLGDEDWNSNYAVKPLEMGGKAWNANRTECKEWLAEKRESGLTIISPAELIHISNMAKVMEQHPLSKLLLDGEVEKSLIWQDPETGVWLKCRPDTLPKFDNTVVDYKTTVNRTKLYQLSADVVKYGYSMQLALIEEGLEFFHGPAERNMILLFQQKSPPYHVCPVEISAELIAIAREQNRSAIRKFAHGIETGEWPGYTGAGDIPIIYPPQWLADEMGHEAAA